MKNKVLISAVLVFVLLMNSFAVFAHSTSQSGILAKEYIDNTNYQDYYIGGETVGWFINESCHTDGYNLTYKLAGSVTSTTANLVSDAATSWTYASSCPIVISENANGIGTIEEYTMASSINAAFCNYAVNSSTGHLTSWRIRVNKIHVNDIGYGTLVHEFGHAIGQTDLYSSINKGKIMYHTSNGRTVSDPQTQDKWGAKVITGYHTSHSWEYIFYRTNSSGVAQHRRRCTYCKGIKYNSVESCTFNAYGVCTKCGHVNGSGTSGVTLPEVTGMSLWEEQRRAYRFLA